MNLITPLMMGISLAAATGLRAWLPLLLTAVFARTGQIPWHEHFLFLTTNPAIGILLVATVIEIGGDFIPGLDHAFDALHTFIRPASATLLVAGLLVGVHPVVGLLVGLMVGASISGLVHLVKAGGRFVVSTATFGLANALLSLLENIVAGILTLFALLAPGLVFFMTLALLVMALLIARQLFRRLRRGWTSLKGRFTALTAPAHPAMGVSQPSVHPLAAEDEFSFFDESEF